jgi:hypothetical protein
MTVIVYRSIETRSCNRCWSGKVLNITYSDYIFVALGIQHAICMFHNVICDLADPRTFFQVSHKWHDLLKNVLNRKYVLIISTTFAWNISYSKKNWARYDHKIFMKISVIFVRFWWDLNNFEGYGKNIQISNVTKIYSVGSELFHADRQQTSTQEDRETDRERERDRRRADMTKLMVAFLQVCEHA